MSLTISIILAIFAVIFRMLAIFYSNIKPSKKGNQSVKKQSEELYKFSHIIAIYCRLILLFLGIGLIIRIVKTSQTTLDAYLVTLVVLIVIFVSKNYYQIVTPIAQFLNPYFIKFANFVGPSTNMAIDLLNKLAFRAGSNPFNKEMLIDLIKNLKPDEDLSGYDLKLAERSLKFSSLIVNDFYTPRKVVKFLDAESEISTVMMDDLYKSGFSRFPVYTSYQDNIVGTLYLKDLIEKKYSGKVSRIMSSEVYEIKESETLANALNQFIKTKHHLFVVKNEFGEILGVITLEDVLEQLIGQEIMDETDKVPDLRLEAIKIKTKEDKEKL